MALISGNILYVTPTDAETTDPSNLVVECPAMKNIKITSFIVSDNSSPAAAYDVTLSKVSPKGGNTSSYIIYKGSLSAGDVVYSNDVIVLTVGESLRLLSSLNGTTSIVFSGEEEVLSTRIVNS